MRTLLANLKRRFFGEPPKLAVRLEPDGCLVMRDEIVHAHIRWNDVREVFAYKDDLFSYDEICIGLRYDEDGSSWWVGECFSGYQPFLEELEARFPRMRKDWFSEVAFPAFAFNRTTLWGEQRSPEV